MSCCWSNAQVLMQCCSRDLPWRPNFIHYALYLGSLILSNSMIDFHTFQIRDTLMISSLSKAYWILKFAFLEELSNNCKPNVEQKLTSRWTFQEIFSDPYLFYVSSCLRHCVSISAWFCPTTVNTIDQSARHFQKHNAYCSATYIW